MTISYCDAAPATCPACGREFPSELWLVLDAEERPDLVAALRSGRLNELVCPHCGHRDSAGAPLLFHDRPGKALIFAGPEATSDHVLRDMLRELHTLLLEQIPEDQQQQYLGDVRITMGLDGLRAILEKGDRRNRARSGGAPRPVVPPPAPDPVPAASDAELPPLLVAVNALLAADSKPDLERVLAAYPDLLAPDADGVLAQLADAATNQREHDVAAALGQARRLLRELRDGATADDPTPPAPPVDAMTEEAVAALLRARSEAELLDAARDFPMLLEPWADAALARRVDAALDLGDERVANAIGVRREALSTLRGSLAGGDTLLGAVQTLLAADDPDSMAAVVDAHPALLTDEALQLLWQIASDARAHGDEDTAAAAIEYRALLREVRAGLGA
jgi:hypothetical protein